MFDQRSLLCRRRLHSQTVCLSAPASALDGSFTAPCGAVFICPRRTITVRLLGLPVSAVAVATPGGGKKKSALCGPLGAGAGKNHVRRLPTHKKFKVEGRNSSSETPVAEI